MLHVARFGPIGCVLAAAGLAGVAAAADTAPGAGLALEPLPRTVGVTIGPDGRQWERVAPLAVGQVPAADAPHAPVDVEDAHALIAFAFESRNPRLDQIVPVLFEPGGRVWFAVGIARQQAPTLVGYDGKTFVDGSLSTPGPGGRGAAVANTFLRPQTRPGNITAYADGAAAFAVGNVVWLFDGNTWTSHECGQPGPACYLFPEPDGKGLIVQAPQAMLRWRDREWTTLRPRAAAENAFGTVVTATDVWTLTLGELARTPLGPEGRRSTAELIRQLSDADAAARDRATDALISRGPAVAEEIKAALAAVGPAEARVRLEHVARQIGPEGRQGAADPTRGVRLGNFTVASPQALIPVPGGGGLVVAESVVESVAAGGGKPAPAVEVRGPGVLRLKPDGTAVRLGGAALAERLMPRRPGAVAPIVIVQPVGKKPLAWVTPVGGAPFRMNLETGEVDRALSLLLQQPPSAVEEDVLFVPMRNGFYRVRGDGKDERPALAATRLADETRDSSAVQTADGTVWVFRSGAGPTDAGVSRFDGDRLTPLAHTAGLALNLQGNAPVVTGYDAVLLRQEGVWRLVTPTQVLTGGSVKEMIASKPEAFAAAFRDAPARVLIRTLDKAKVPYVYADAAGNVWLLGEDSLVSVFAGGAWRDVPAPVDERLVLSTLVSIAPVGDGAHVFLSVSTGRLADGIGHLLSFENGRFVVAEAPVLVGQTFLREKEGIWYLAGTSGTPAGESEAVAPPGPVAELVRLTGKGVAERLPMATPLAVDSAGNVWIRENDRLSVYADGKRVNVTEPGDPLAASAVLYAGGGGRVYAVSDLGVQEFTVARGRATPEKAYRPLEDSAVRFSQPLGFFYSSGANKPLTVVKLPG